MAYTRSRKRYGTADGGFPLGQILAMALGGGGANPAFGATEAAAAAAGTSPEGMVDFNYKGDPSAAIGKFGTDLPYRPNNVFQKFYSMDDSDIANKKLTVDRITADEEGRRKLAEMPQVAKLQTEAKIAADEAIRKAAIARLAPTLARAGLLPAGPMNDEAATADWINLYGIGAAEQGAYPALGAGDKARVTSTASNQEREAREKFPKDVEKGIRGEFLQPSFRQVGGVDRDITDPATWFSATPETRGGIDPMTGAMMEAQSPSLVHHTKEGFIRPKSQKTAAAPAPAAPVAAPAGPRPGASEFIGPTQLVPSLSQPGTLGYGPQPESLMLLRKWLEEQARRAMEALPTNAPPVPGVNQYYPGPRF